MRVKLKAALLMALTAAAVFTGAEAYRSLRPVSRLPMPEDIYSRFAAGADSAQFFIRNSGGYVAVFEDDRYRTPTTVTEIETAYLRGADRAMLEAGIPVADRRALLLLLEDLGS